MKIKNWITCVQDRGKWKDVVEKELKEVQCLKKKKTESVYLSLASNLNTNMSFHIGIINEPSVPSICSLIFLPELHSCCMY